MTLGVLRPPGDFGVDVAVGEGQPLGNRLDFGGPSFGFFAAQEAFLRRMPGRIAGETTRRRRPPRLRAHAADARAAHPPREGDVEHLHRPGAQRADGHGLPELARPPGLRGARPPAAAAHGLRARRAGRGRRRRAACTSSRSCASSPCALDAPVATRRDRALLGARASTPATRSAATTPSSRTACWSRSPSSAAAADIDRLASALEAAVAAEPPGGGGVSVQTQTPQQRERATTIFEKSVAGPARVRARPALDVPERPLDELLPERFRRTEAPKLPGGLRAGDQPPLQPAVQAQLRPRHGLLPARLVHDEAQPEAPRARRRAARATRACTRCRTRAAPRARCS